MRYLCLMLALLCINIKFVLGQTFATDPEIDSTELRCLVCEKSIYELTKKVNRLDPNKKVDVGGYRLDVDGNYGHKSIPQTRSELALSELIEGVCTEMDNYVRAKRKRDGSLTLLNMLSEDGTMNPDWSEVDIIQDGDLNKSLKYYCESIMEEYEDEIIKLYQEDETDVSDTFCVKQSNICPQKKIKSEL
ncbi:protein seele [Diabrotica virgifera virgifera]|uniref:Protein seele n=1 Tax=Diabrotica virgifera virgifera TaxID=50390 RepID=A0A6P7FJM4_DIAVI|nr:protein seele [Diabrotica virgifera virgifera]